MDLEEDTFIGAGYDRGELLQVAEAVARDKGIESEEVVEAMEQAIQKAARSRYGQENDVRAVIDRKTGEIQLARYMEVAEPVENESMEISIDDAKRLNPDAQVGDFLSDAARGAAGPVCSESLPHPQLRAGRWHGFAQEPLQQAKARPKETRAADHRGWKVQH